MKQFLLTMAGVFAGLMLFLVVIPFVLVVAAMSQARPAVTPSDAVLSLDLRRSLTDQTSSSPLAALSSESLSVMSVVQALHRAETDGRIKALFVRLPETGMAPGEADELRLAFKRFEAAGKPVIAHSQGIYEIAAVPNYMLGASASSLWMQPGAPFQAVGVASDSLFFKRFFDKYGIQPQFEQRYEYKTAVNAFLYDDYTAADRESELSWMGAIYDADLASAAGDRHVPVQQLKTAIEAGPYDAGDAKAHGLIDQIGEVDDAKAAALAAGGDDAKLVSVEDYAADGLPDGLGGQPAIGVVSAEGVIMTGPSHDGLGGRSISSDDVCAALDAAAKDDAVKAIVFRLSSPGGSDTASEQISGCVRAAKAKKPVVVSMGVYGASGGYWVAADASSIVAEPTTLTGSIGVFGGKFVLAPALSKFGVDMRQISIGGDYAGAEGAAQPFTPSQHAAFAAAIDRVYDRFVAHVAAGRRLPQARVAEIARGRVWTGAQAKPLGLIDQIGGFYDAVDRAKALAGLSGQAVRLKMVSAPHSLMEALERAFGVSSTAMRTLFKAAQLLADPKVQSMVEQVSQAQASADGANLLSPVRAQ